MPSTVLFVEDDVQTLSVDIYKIVRANADVGTIRIKSLHLDMVFSPNTSAFAPVVLETTLHRVHEDVANANLVTAQGTRVKHERVAIGLGTDRYYRMWLKQINLEYGYNLVLVVRPIDIAGGTPTYGLAARWFELQPDVP